MKQKVHLLILFVIVFITSCNKKENQFNPSPEINKNRVVTIEQAKALSSFISNMIFTKDDNSPKLKSSNGDKYRTVKSVTPINKDGITILYSVNFDNELGYLLSSADNNSFPIVSMVDSGSFDINKVDVNSPTYAWIEERKNIILDNLNKPVDTENGNFNLWSGIVPNDSIEIEISYNTPPEAPNLKARRQHSTGKQSLYSWTGQRLKWGQRNRSNVDLRSPYQGWLIGCPAIATGMLFYHNWHPSNYGYMYMPVSFPTSGPYSSTATSQMLATLAHNYQDLYHSGYTTGNYSYFQNINSSGTLPLNILTYLRNNGYRDANYGDYDFETVYNNIKNHGSVLLAGWVSQNNPSGHIWFSDGYYEQSWTVTQKKKFLGITTSTKTWTEYADFLYMNWGWDNGQSNGWYNAATQEAAPNSGNSTIPYTYNRKMYTNLYPTYN